MFTSLKATALDFCHVLISPFSFAFCFPFYFDFMRQFGRIGTCSLWKLQHEQVITTEVHGMISIYPSVRLEQIQCVQHSVCACYSSFWHCLWSSVLTYSLMCWLARYHTCREIGEAERLTSSEHLVCYSTLLQLNKGEKKKSSWWNTILIEAWWMSATLESSLPLSHAPLLQRCLQILAFYLAPLQKHSYFNSTVWFRGQMCVQSLQITFIYPCFLLDCCSGVSFNRLVDIYYSEGQQVYQSGRTKVYAL